MTTAAIISISCFNSGVRGRRTRRESPSKGSMRPSRLNNKLISDEFVVPHLPTNLLRANIARVLRIKGRVYLSGCGVWLTAAVLVQLE